VLAHFTLLVSKKPPRGGKILDRSDNNLKSPHAFCSRFARVFRIAHAWRVPFFASIACITSKTAIKMDVVPGESRELTERARPGPKATPKMAISHALGLETSFWLKINEKQAKKRYRKQSGNNRSVFVFGCRRSLDRRSQISHLEECSQAKGRWMDDHDPTFFLISAFSEQH